MLQLSNLRKLAGGIEVIIASVSQKLLQAAKNQLPYIPTLKQTVQRLRKPEEAFPAISRN